MNKSGKNGKNKRKRFGNCFGKGFENWRDKTRIKRGLWKSIETFEERKIIFKYKKYIISDLYGG